MPEKLLNLEDAARFLRMSEEEIVSLVENGEIPAYKIGGKFLRFRKEQLEAISDEVKDEPVPVAPHAAAPARREDRSVEAGGFFDRVLDFIYFSDFYIISILLVAVMLYAIFK